MQGNIKQTCQAKSILCQVRRKPETNSLMPREKGNYKRDKYTLLKLFRGQKMHIQYPEIKIWNPTKIINTGKTPRSYIIMTESNKQLRYNRIHIHPTLQKEPCLCPCPHLWLSQHQQMKKL